MPVFCDFNRIRVHDVANEIDTIWSVCKAKDEHAVIRIHNAGGIAGTGLRPIKETGGNTPRATRAVPDQVVVACYDGAQASLFFGVVVVGGTKQVHFDKIKDLKPDIILCNKEENTQEMVLELEKIAPVWVSDIKTVEDCCEMILSLGQLFAKQDVAFKITQQIQVETKIFAEFINNKPSYKVA